MSRLDISIRHFTVPWILLILLLAPVPRLLAELRTSAPLLGRSLTAVAATLALGSIATALRAYPYYLPYLSPLALGRPGYALVNDSNVDWSQALPEVRRFAQRRGLGTISIDAFGMSDTSTFVPGSRSWNCQRPTEAQAGQWVAVSANMIEDQQNCIWLMQYPHESLGGGSMYAVHLPATIPPPGSPKGPPPPAAQRELFGFPADIRSAYQEAVRHPETLPKMIEQMQAAGQSLQKPPGR